MVARVRGSLSPQTPLRALRERGLLTLGKWHARLGISRRPRNSGGSPGLLRAHAYNDKHQYLYEPPGPDAPRVCVERNHAMGSSAPISLTSDS